MVEGVLFVPQTPGSKLAKLLQAKMDQMCSLMGLDRKVRYVERSGSKLIELLGDADPWKDVIFGRAHCQVEDSEPGLEDDKGLETAEEKQVGTCNVENVTYMIVCKDCRRNRW